jgi:hypothetical protein
MVKVCLLSFGRSGTTFIIDMLKKLNNSNYIIDFELNEKQIEENCKNMYLSEINYIFKYIFTGDLNYDLKMINMINKNDFKFIFIDRNLIDRLVSGKLAKKNNKYSNSDYSDERIELDISEIYDINNYSNHYFIELNKIIQYKTIYYEQFLTDNYCDIHKICKFFNDYLNSIEKTQDITYFSVDKADKFNFLQKQNNNETSLNSINNITNKYKKNDNEIMSEFICENTRIKNYYSENIKIIPSCSCKIHILNYDFVLFINANLSKYINNETNTALYYNDLLVLLIIVDNNKNFIKIHDNSLFLDFKNFDFELEKTKIINKYINLNIILLNESKNNSIVKFTDYGFIIHNDDESNKIKYLYNLSNINLVNKLYYVEAICYKNDEDVFKLCNYLLYRNYFINELYNDNLWDSYTMSKIALTLSNLLVLNYCKINNINSYFIFEDDIITNKILLDINDCYKNSPSDSDIIYFGIKQDFRDGLIYVNDYFYYKNKYSWGGFAYFINNMKTTDILMNYYYSFKKCIDCYTISELKFLISTKNYFIQDYYDEKNIWKYKWDDFNKIEVSKNFVVFDNIFDSSKTWKLFVNNLKNFQNNSEYINYNSELIKHDTIVFFDFVDHYFGWNCNVTNKSWPVKFPYKWGGIIHHPIKLEPFWGHNVSIESYFTNNSNYITNSLENCKFLIFLNRETMIDFRSSDIIKNFPEIKLYCIYHIYPFFDPISNRESKFKYLTFLGWSFRNFKLFHELKCDNLNKIHLPGITTDEQKERVNNIINIHTNNSLDSSITSFYNLTTEEFMEIISFSIIFLDFDGVSANNSVVECIKYNIPLLIRRCREVEFYLGSNYPMYFNDINDINKILNNIDYFSKNAIEYFKNMNKLKFSLTYNVLNVLEIINN